MSEVKYRVMASIKKFEDIVAWQKALELNKIIYQLTQTDTIKKDFSFTDQIRRSSLSIVCNIAEGFERQSDKEFSRFLHIAKGSAAEVRALLYVAKSLDYINDKQFEELLTKIVDIGNLVYGLIKYLNKNFV